MAIVHLGGGVHLLVSFLPCSLILADFFSNNCVCLWFVLFFFRVN